MPAHQRVRPEAGPPPRRRRPAEPAPHRPATCLIGCSGWQYKHWRGDFYPASLPPRRWLSHYAERFDTVEINNTFYRLPEAETFAGWRRLAPAGFVYAVKASRYLTHMKKLKEPREPLKLFFSRAAWLRDRLRSGIDVYAYFNNDVGGHAPRDAVRLRRMILAQDTKATEDTKAKC